MGQELTVRAPRGVSRSFDTETLVSEWYADMMLRASAGEMSQDTANTYRRAMAKFIAWVEGQGLDNVGPNAIRGWKASLLQDGHQPQGVNTWLAGVKHFFTWAVAFKGLAYNPAAAVQSAKRKASRTHKRDALSDTEVQRLLGLPYSDDARGRRDKAMVYLMAFTGCRRVELQRASIGDIRTNGKVKVVVHGKGGDDRDVYIHPDAEAALYDWLAVHPNAEDADAALFCGLGNRNHGRRLSRRAISAILKGYYKQAGIRSPLKTVHSMRHSVVTHLLRRGYSPLDVMALTGHKDTKTLLGYWHELQREANPIELAIDWGQAG